MKKTVLLIDDEEKLRSLLSRLLTLEGFEIRTANSLKAARQVLHKVAIPVLLCDVKLPDGDGVDFVKEVKQLYPAAEIILLTAYGNIPDGVRAMRDGAFDYMVKGNDNDKIIPLLYKAFEQCALKSRLIELERRVEKRYSFDNILGQSAAILRAKELAGKVALTDSTVLLLGETGTGKEVFAQAIHAAGKRSHQPFVALNCSAFSKDLLESQLFGHLAGAFTSAIKDKQGLMEAADRGTLFLDEIGEMPLELQAKLLRVLETSEFIKVGDTKATRVDVRIIAATNRHLEAEVTQGRFREDLFYRLNVFSIPLPSLNDRRKDIALLADFYLQSFACKMNKPVQRVSKAFLEQLHTHHWKGNIRELKNVIERAVIVSDEEELSVYSLPPNFKALPASPAFSLAAVEKQHIIKMLQYAGGNKTETARLLEIGLTTLYRKIEEYQIG